MEISNYTRVVITGEDRSGSAFDSLKRKTIDTERSFQRLKSVMSTLGVGISFGGAFALLKEGVQQFLEAEKSINRLNAVLQTTGNTIGFTGVELESLAQKLSKQAFINDDAIRDGISQMLLFKNVTGETAKEAITLAANYAAAFGGDVSSAIENIGRALEAPANGAKSLRSLNVILSDSQQELIKDFIKTSDTASAQGFILEQLKDLYGDLAEKINKGPLAESNRLKLAWGEMLKSLGKSPATSGFFGWAADGFNQIKFFMLDPSIRNFLAIAGGYIEAPSAPINTAALDLLAKISATKKEIENLTQVSDVLKGTLANGIATNRDLVEKNLSQYADSITRLKAELADTIKTIGAPSPEKQAALDAEFKQHAETDLAAALEREETVREEFRKKALANAAKFRSELQSLLQSTLPLDNSFGKFAADVDVLNKALAASLIPQQKYNEAFDAMIAARADVVGETKKYIEAQKELKDAYDSDIEALADADAAYEKEIKSIKDATEALKPYSREMTIAAKIVDLMGTHTDKTTEQIRAMAIEYANATEEFARTEKAIAAQKEIQDEVRRTADTLESTFHDGFVRALEGNLDSLESFSQSALNTLRSTFADQVYKIYLQPTILNFSTALATALSGQGGANTSTGGGGGFGIGDLSSLTNVFSAGSTAAINGIGAGLGLVNPISGVGILGNGLGPLGASVPASGSLGALASAVPWLAIAAVALPFISGLFDDGPAERTAKFVTGTRGTNPRFSTGTPFGLTGISEDSYFSDQEMAQALDAFIAGISTTDKQIVEQLNLSTDQITAAKLNLEDLNNKTYNFGTEHEGIEGLTEITRDRYAAIFQAVNEDLSLLIATYDQADDKIGEYITGAVQLYKALDKVGDVMPELSKSLIAFASLSGQQLVDTAAIINYASADPIKDAAELVRLQSRTLTQVWNEQGTELRKLIAEYDGSATATSQLAALTQSRYQIELQLAQQIMQVLDASHTLFASSAEQIRFSVLSETEKYNSLRNKSLELEGILASATGPAKIYELAQQLNEVTTQAFGLLTADQQKQQAEPFANYLEELDSLVQQKLQDVQATLSGEHDTSLPNSIAAVIETAMEKAAAKFMAAAEKQLLAAQTPLTVDSNVDVNVRGYVTTATATTEVGR